MGSMLTENYFQFGVNKYFRGNAHLVRIGTYGEKKDPIGAKAYIDPEETVDTANLVSRVERGSPVSIDWSQSSQGEVEVDGLQVKVFQVGATLAGSYSYAKLKTASLRLMNFNIPEASLRTMLNTQAGAARNFLAREGADGRIVSEVWVVLEATLSQHLETSSSFSASVSGTDIKLTASGGTSGTQTITLSRGSTFAYKMHKVTDWNSGKTQILDMEADYKGFS